LDNKKVIWGMGHREYSTKDPRAIILERMLKEKIDKSDKKYSKILAIALEVESQSAKFLNPKKVYANVDFYSGVLYSIIGIEPDQYTAIFAVARATGWIAHFFEQIKENKIFRPTQIYVGCNNRKYVSPL
jgi:citrate synthase